MTGTAAAAAKGIDQGGAEPPGSNSPIPTTHGRSAVGIVTFQDGTTGRHITHTTAHATLLQTLPNTSSRLVTCSGHSPR